MGSGFCGKRKCQLFKLTLRKSQMRMWLFLQSIHWGISRFYAHGCQNIVLSSYAGHQDQAKQWPWCQPSKLCHNLRWSSWTSPPRQTLASSWSNFNITASTTKQSVESFWDPSNLANGWLSSAIRLTYLTQINTELWLLSLSWGSWLSSMDFGEPLIDSGLVWKGFSLLVLVTLQLILVVSLWTPDF